MRSVSEITKNTEIRKYCALWSHLLPVPQAAKAKQEVQRCLSPSHSAETHRNTSIPPP